MSEPEPIRAWKRANLTGNPDRPFRGIGGNSRPYGVEDVAHCAHDGYGYSGRFYPEPERGHVAPDEKCSCGFYAVPSRAASQHAGSGDVWLEVELYGKVIIGEAGYRAEKQRVLAVWSRRDRERCNLLTLDMRYNPDGSLSYMHDNGFWLRWEPGDGDAMVCGKAVRYTVLSSGLAVCAGHALACGRRFVEREPVSLDLGTEWRWLDDDEPSAAFLRRMTASGGVGLSGGPSGGSIIRRTG